ncbi:hypothetical protein EYF80_034751 [Liparis tanakae]|uniref:Uncharacterized protein n=1 Tax=Liparis tanakae TaxID=230148 RepID=A0A4Z2GPM2_9TELE|nr:hypothetical protein EYF80_034751 [Liparis tanakae]
MSRAASEETAAAMARGGRRRANVTRTPPAITLAGSTRHEGEGFREAERVRSHSSHVTTPPQGGGDGEAEPRCSCKPTGEKEVSGHRKQSKSAPSSSRP